MGICKYCGEDAGWFKGEHPRCTRSHSVALAQMREACATAAKTGEGNETLRSTLDGLAEEGHVDSSEIRPMMVKAWGVALDEVRADIVLGRDDHLPLSHYKLFHGINEEELARFGLSDKMHQVALLRCLIQEGEIPEYNAMRSLVGDQPRSLFSLIKSESLLWTFPKAEYLTEVRERHYSAGSSGFSFRVAKGVTYRVGQTRGHSYTTEHLRVVDSGILGVSTKHIYWAGQRGFGKSKSFRIRLNRIVSVEHSANGVAVMRDTQSARPEAFRGFDGQFASVLIMVASAALDEGGFTRSDRTLDELVDDAGMLFTAGADISDAGGLE